jgi:hypothetical protein
MPDITFLPLRMGEPGGARHHHACDLLAELDGSTFVVDLYSDAASDPTQMTSSFLK